MDRLEFYKSLYERENLRRDVLTNSVSIPIGIVSGVVAALVYLTTNYKYIENKLCSCIFFILVIICVIFVLISIFYIARSLNNLVKGHSYRELALPSEMENYYHGLKACNLDDKDKTDEEFSEYLTNEFTTYADHNIKINDSRSLDLYNAKSFLFISVIVIAFASIPYVYGIYKGPKKKINVRIENINNDIEYKLKIDSILKYINMSENKAPKSKEKPSRPKPPQGRSVKGSRDDIHKSVISKSKKL
ncbi:MAG: hypothetical protein WBG43_04420 [Marinifilaceae bacterium]